MLSDCISLYIDGKHLEHLAGALGVGGGDGRGVHFHKAVAAEERMQYIVNRICDAHDRCNFLGAWPQVRLGPQELHSTLELLLEGQQQ